MAIFLWRRILVARTDRPGSGFCICLRNWPGWVFAASLLASHRIPQLFLFNSQTKWGDSVKTTTEADREKMKEEREGERRREGRDTDDKLAPQLILIRAKGKTSVSLKEHWVPWYKQFFLQHETLKTCGMKMSLQVRNQKIRKKDSYVKYVCHTVHSN